MSETDLPRILCVDDEPKLLAAMQRTLFGTFEVVTAESGALGLAIIQQEEPFAVVMSDMRMPGMDGATFLAKARSVAPDSVRILLTGQADLASSIAAINQGAIFRYLCKPCPADELLATLDQALTQYRLVRAEKHLLETTLTASVKTLTEVLTMAAPWAFQRAAFAEACVRHAVPRLGWPDGWIYSVAAALSQIGCVSIPAEVVHNDAANRTLTPQEVALLRSHPEVAYRLVKAIPRLEVAAQIILHQDGRVPPDASVEVKRGAQLLRAALILERHRASDKAMARPRDILMEVQPAIPENIVKALADFRTQIAESRAVRVRDLMPGWVVEEDVHTGNGMMVLAKGHELTDTAIAALQRLRDANAIADPIRVRCRA